MNDGVPKQMRRSQRNFLHRIGKKFEENLRLSSSNLSQNTRSPSTTSYSFNQLLNNQEQRDSASSQDYRRSYSESLDQNYPSNNVQTYDPSYKYDQEMQMICKDILENRIKRLTDYWDYDKKVSLLRMAMSYNTPKITVPVLLYLENSLSKSLFYELIQQFPAAIHYYINLTRLHPDSNHYLTALKQLGKNEDIAMIHIRDANKSPSLTNKVVLLDQAAIALSSSPWWYSLVLEYKHLLQKQREIQRYLASLRAETPLEHQPFLRTYKIVYSIDFQQQKYRRHKDEKIIKYLHDLESDFYMTAEMVTCGKLAVVMKCGFRTHYNDFLQLTTHQGFFGKKYVISPENFAEMIYNWIKFSGEGLEKASEEAGKFLIQIPNATRRLYYAEKFQNYDIAMDTIANVLRDRAQLESLLRRIPQEHPSYNRAVYLLENTKWKS